MEHIIRPVAHIVSDFPTKFGIPRQAGIVAELESTVVFEEEYRDPEALRGMEQCSHLWLIWQFSENITGDGQSWSPTVRPPRLGGNVRMGVFATRSPFRPNSLGLSCVKLERIERTAEHGTVLHVSGADLMNGTPIFDIKPYVPYADSKPDALTAFAPDAGGTLAVEFERGCDSRVPQGKLAALRGILANDPRPRYQNDPERVYALEFAGMEIRFRVENGTVYVQDILRPEEKP